MTEDQRKKYEEAANHHSDTHFSFHSDITAMQRESFFMGCTFASQELDVEMQELVDETHHLGEQLIIEKEHNKRLIESLSDCLTLLTECSYDATEVTEKAHKLLNQ